MALIKNQTARDKAWANHYAKRGFLPPITKSTQTLTRGERYAQWAKKYFDLPFEVRKP